MPTCGACKLQGQTIEHIRDCYSQKRTSVATIELTGAAKRYVEQKDFRPMALISEIPASMYALEVDEVLKFYKVSIGKVGTRWDGFRFLDLLVGHPNDWATYAVKNRDERKKILGLIAADPKAAALRYAHEFTRCGVCNSPLSDPESVARGLGPTCAERF